MTGHASSPARRRLRTALARTVDALGLRRLVFRTREWLISRGDRRTEAPGDPLAVPSPYLRTLVIGTPDLDWFLQSGRRDAEEFLDALARNGAAPLPQASVLEWGCGCGRLSRWIAPRAARFVGVDINPRLLGWCVDNLPGDYRRTALAPPAPLPGAAFDIVYGCSVLTHLREASARAWLAELERVLKPGGRLLLTFHDPEHPGAAELQETLAERGWAVRFDALEGSNNLAAYATAGRLASLAPDRLSLEDYTPSSASTSLQAVAVFAKAPA